jgi:hypothetical protein
MQTVVASCAGFSIFDKLVLEISFAKKKRGARIDEKNKMSREKR